MDEGQVYWFTGNTGAGKTAYAKEFIDWIREGLHINVVHLDGDVLRDEVFRDHDLTPRGRWVHNMRTARLAKVLSDQGNLVVVSLICPYGALQQQVKELTNCIAIRVDGGAPDTLKTPYHPWKDPHIVLPQYSNEEVANVNWHNIFICAK